MPSFPIRAAAGVVTVLLALGATAADTESPQYFVASGELTAADRVLIEPSMVLQANQPGEVALTDGHGNPKWRIRMTVENPPERQSMSWHTQVFERVEGSWRLLSERVLTFKPGDSPSFTGESASKLYEAAIKCRFTLEPHEGDEPPVPKGFER